MSLSAQDLLRELLRIPSINPVFGSADGSGSGEAKLTDFLQEIVAGQGWKWLRQEVHPQRENLVALIPASNSFSGDPVTLWEVHQDTVGIEGMRIDPFAAEQREGRIYGRGACDVKGSMAAMIAAISLAAEQEACRGTTLLAFAINEECGFTGAKALCRLWEVTAEVDEKTHGTLSLDELRPLRPQRAIVAEPTDLKVVKAHKGIVRWRCHTHGHAAHSSQPQRGKNAIYAMNEVITAIRQFDAEALSGRGADCICGRPTVSVNTIQGGTGANVVPDHAVIEIDRRLMPGEEPADAHQELIDYIAAHISAEQEIKHEPPWNLSRGLQAGENLAWAEEVAKVARSAEVPSDIVGVPYGTDAWVIAGLGIPTVVFGPGSIAQAHTDDEWIAVEELEKGVEVYRRLAGGVS
ncbi:M20 family metallopeptidase [Bythopirellula polymerisocia]|uniref:Acetylornithine deacetylase n=1 Tax=Bythopirellula polymerisocia TaxID=2528003 RepID=A0A5C6CDV4_9BACT|nr:M20 family metallopeptidase [Bythopirellula polymerisocia]TWU21937.1 Acetylornithine deacetylase [Bythopirellula polymerisocia]